IPNEQEDEYETGQDLYLMYYDEQVSIWPDQTRPGVHIVNHSCEPNVGITTYRGHSLYFALRAIHRDEELLLSYLLGPGAEECAPGEHACWAGGRSCTGRMHWRIDRYVAGSRFDERERALTGADPVEASQPLLPLDRYPSRIPDRGFHAI